MCEYCGCQDITVLADLTREHDAVVAELAILRRELAQQDLDAAAKTARRLTQILGPHTEVEEQGLFPLMADDFPATLSTMDSEGWLAVEATRGRAGTGLATRVMAGPPSPEEGE